MGVSMCRYKELWAHSSNKYLQAPPWCQALFCAGDRALTKTGKNTCPTGVHILLAGAKCYEG